MAVTALYAALLAALFCYLTVRVIGARRRAKVSLGDGGDAQVLRAIRVHGNFIETVPLALIMLAAAESLAAPTWALHLLGAALFLGRSLHALGVSREPEDFRLRVSGMATTLTVIGLLAVLCLALSAMAGFGF